MESNSFYIMVDETFKVSKSLQLETAANSKLKFIIKCDFVRTSSTLKTNYYSNQLYDSNNDRLIDNTFIWNEITCTILEDEIWTLVKKPSHNGVALTAIIKDKLNNSLEMQFDNTNHDDCAYQELFNYILDLKEYSTHYSVLEIKNRDSKILELKEKINTL